MNTNYKNFMYIFCVTSVMLVLSASCSIQKKIHHQANNILLNTNQLNNAQVGISIYQPSTKKYLYNHQAKKYFIPASNTKIFTCYAAMKNLGDSLVGAHYINDDNTFIVQFSADPTFLHPNFIRQPVLDFLKNNSVVILKNNNNIKPWGRGWAWDDFNDDYMAERSVAPIFGNVVHFEKKGNQLFTFPTYFKDSLTIFSSTQHNQFNIERNFFTNQFSVLKSNKKFTSIDIPFITSELLTIALLEDSLHKHIEYIDAAIENKQWKKIFSQSTDSLLKIIMHRSDNFFAEQCLLMIGNEKFGNMNDALTIDTLLKTDFKLLPQPLKWVDGSGLSRYNLCTPQDLVWVLNCMKDEFGWARTSTIFSEGNSGSLSGYYTQHAKNICAKTGTLSNIVALSGYITTKKKKECIFSILINQHQSTATEIRRLIEKFLIDFIEKN